ncbi:TonB-dependent receptor [Novosphingobium sp. RL4]|uniref:TonB-dependent receptor n=1 Tax=Novosphingobium sp. RL4 TaxID=3109595 RepID=UPI002D792E7F|nr:TonB-dependent receptor [Novosphingobium sp. RL4]WRT96043.1 TonB-dependent receptor [Novosphingobium sp. RL4]
MGKFLAASRWGAGSAVAAVLMAQAVPAFAEEQRFDLDIPSQSLGSALRSFASAARQQVIFDGASVANRTVPALKGSFTARAALGQLLRGTGLTAEQGASGVFVVRRAPVSPVPASQAQPAADTGGDEPEMTELVVTGSRIRRTEFDSPIPVVALQKEDISEHGYRDLAEALQDIPGVDQGLNLSAGQTSTQTNGLSTVSLRGLGQNRTLTLIDGHRTVSNVGNSNAVSLSTIPTFLVDRIDVSTGGASAVYGSDAIAGVVNIMTDNNLIGIKGRAAGTATNDGGGDGTEYSLAAGGKFLDDRLYLMATGTYEKQYALSARDRDWALESVSYDATSNTVSSPALSSYTPGGRFLSSRGAYYYDENGLQSGFVTAENGYDSRTNGTLIVPRESISAAGKIGYEFSDSLKFKATVLYSRITTNSLREPYYLSNSSSYGVNDEFTLGRLSRTNPFVPDVIAAASTSSGIDFRRRLTEVGQMAIDNKRETWRTWAGFEGTVFGNWNWDVTYGFGRFEQNQTRTNGVNYQHVQYALNATRLSDGSIVCADEAARADGCVPLNMFGIGSISDAAADYIRGNVWYQSINSQHTLSGNLTGTLFELPAGPVQIATGFELRRDHTETHTDELTASGYSNFAYIPEYAGTVKVGEAYAEANVPLLRDIPLIYRLSLDGAVRVARYNLSGVGTTLSYRAGAQWEPVRGMNLRSTFSRAQRAPDTTELYSPPRDDYDTVVDICSGVTAATAGTVADNCRSNAGIAAAIAADGVFRQDSTSVNAPNAGNADLKEETAYTFTAGVVVNPGFLPGFQASVDYYDIRVKDAISALSNTNQMLECYSDAEGYGNRFCDAITRDAEGQITRLVNQQENLDELRARGIDVAVAYQFRPEVIPGNIQFSLNYNHRLELGTKYQGIASQSSENWLGEVGTSKDSAKASLAWNSKRFMLKWTTVYIGKAVDSNEAAASFAAAGITDPLFLNVPAYWRHDLSFRITPPLANPNLRIFGSVRNVFNKYGPFLPDGTESGSQYNYNSVYGVTGRSFTLGAQFQF